MDLPAPLIGLTGRRKKASDVAGFADSLDDLDVDLYLADYARGIVAAGGFRSWCPSMSTSSYSSTALTASY